MIELLVVAVIISILASLLLPALAQAKDGARQGICISNLKGMVATNAMYDGDNDGFAVHGTDMEAFWPTSITGYGRAFFPTYILDDDWWDSKPGVEGRNLHGGGQNICHIGQLMWDGYVSKEYGALACPQADHRENKGYNYGMKNYADQAGGSWNSTARGCIQSAWEAEAYSGNPSYAYIGTTYNVRGPLLRVDRQADASSTAFFADHEQASQDLIALIPTGGSPDLGWPRTHLQGINVGYLDGHTRLYRDADRSHTYWSDQTRYYGNGFALFGGGYDEQ